MAEPDPKRLTIDMRCGCGAWLVIEWPKDGIFDDRLIVGFATTWTNAHRHDRAEQPKGKG